MYLFNVWHSRHVHRFDSDQVWQSRLRAKASVPILSIIAIIALSNPKPVYPAGPEDTVGFKTAGSLRAPVVLELYSDYQCPSCRSFYFEILPRLNEEYVKSGKVYLIYRDFPLVRHNWSRVAARYANAAGEIGRYDSAVEQLFKSQAEWSVTGNVDSSLSMILSAPEMIKIRSLVRSDPRLDELIETDLAAAQRDGIAGTPAVEFVVGAYRQHIPGTIPYKVLKAYLDQLISSVAITPNFGHK